MSAEREIRQAMLRLEAMSDEVFVGVAVEAQSSIQFGSPLTGAPGQPVDTSNEINSWQLTYPTPDLAAIDTNVDYAEAIEDGVGPHGARAYGAERSPAAQANGGSTVGGSHSVALTIAGLPRIVDAVVQRVSAEHGQVLDGSGGWRGEDGG